MKGTYCLVLKLERDETILINKKGHDFRRGYYVYVGSGVNNLEKRIERHKSLQKKKFWHVDYFLEYAKILNVKTIVSHERRECEVSRKVKQLADDEPMKGFGSSDCSCNTHLYYFKTNPVVNERFMKLFVK